MNIAKQHLNYETISSPLKFMNNQLASVSSVS